MTEQDLKKLIREIPDFPKPGILFYDITTLLKDPAGFRGVIDGLTEADVGAAMRVGMQAGIACGAACGLLRISAGNYGGKLGPFHFHLRKLLGEGGP